MVKMDSSMYQGSGNPQQQQQHRMPPNNVNNVHSSSHRDRSSRPSASSVNGHHSQQHHQYPPPSPETLEAMNSTKVTPQLLEYIQRTAFPYINDVSMYEKKEKIGQGTFGEVFKAKCKRTGKIVALKKILMENEKEGFPITALREVKMLQQLKHENITDLIEVCSSKTSSNPRDRSTFYLVFAFCEHDLAGLLSNRKVKLGVQHIKTLLKHLLNGLAKLHRSKILHRDMKTANVLLNKEGVLRLADFGLARPYFHAAGQTKHLYTNRVVTLWYRPPELLLGDRMYTPSIDTWGAGCIMAELWTRTPILQGETEQKQLQLITNLCGSITPQVWPGVVEMPLWGKIELAQNVVRCVRTKMFQLIKDDRGVDMLDQLLCLNPTKRLEAEKALEHPYFFAHPHPMENVKDLMDTIETSQFEYTAGRGAHQNRARQHQAQRANQQARNNSVIPPGHCHDMVF